MRRTTLVLAFALTLTANVGALVAAEFDLPPGKWWEDERLVTHLQLTTQQQGRIKDLVYEHAQRMVDRNAQMEKTKLALENLVDQEPFDAAAVRRAFAAFQEARRQLETEHFEMLLAVREVLNHDQWEALITLRQRLQRLRERLDSPRGQRPEGGRFPRRDPQRPGPEGR